MAFPYRYPFLTPLRANPQNSSSQNPKLQKPPQNKGHGHRTRSIKKGTAFPGKDRRYGGRGGSESTLQTLTATSNQVRKKGANVILRGAELHFPTPIHTYRVKLTIHKIWQKKNRPKKDRVCKKN